VVKTWRFSKWLFSSIVISLFFILIGCIHSSTFISLETNKKKDVYQKLQVGMTYEQILAIMGPPGDYAKEEACYRVNSFHMQGPIDRYWSDDYQNIVLFFDHDDRLTGKDLFPAIGARENRFPWSLLENLNVFP
jgi:hypothetical protein